MMKAFVFWHNVEIDKNSIKGVVKCREIMYSKKDEMKFPTLIYANYKN